MPITACARRRWARFLDPVWSCMGLHTPAEFNKRHIPACFGGVAPRDWAMVYPFVRSYDWYLKAPEERARIMAEHGRNGFAQYPDVKGSTLSAFGFSDYEWVRRVDGGRRPGPPGRRRCTPSVTLRRVSTCARTPRSSRVRA